MPPNVTDMKMACLDSKKSFTTNLCGDAPPEALCPSLTHAQTTIFLTNGEAVASIHWYSWGTVDMALAKAA